jgi:hypothetical protein
LYADDADTNIYRVVAFVQQDFGGDDFLELSESQSQSVDGSEQVTQTQDVPFQLAAYEDHILAKIQRAKERRSKLAADLLLLSLRVIACRMLKPLMLVSVKVMPLQLISPALLSLPLIFLPVIPHLVSRSPGQLAGRRVSHLWRSHTGALVFLELHLLQQGTSVQALIWLAPRTLPLRRQRELLLLLI